MLLGCLHSCLFLEVVLWLGRDNEDVLNFSFSSNSMEFFSIVSVTDIQTGDVNIRNMRSRHAGFLIEARVWVSITVGPVRMASAFT